MIYDLHCHTTASDGQLTPTELVQRAADKGVTHLSITDHDTINGLQEAQIKAKECGINLINGVELSTQWKDYNIHIVGLNIDLDNELLQKGLRQQNNARENRYQTTLELMSKDGIFDKEMQIQKFAGNHVPGRPNMARFLVENNHVDSYATAYKKLSRGGDYYVNPGWEYMSYAVNWIVKAGGIAVIAHPDKYGISKPGFRGFLRDFINAGGRSIEVCYGAGSKKAMNKAAYFAREYKLIGSVGSDFHRPGSPGIELGKIASLPRGIEPIWDYL